MHIINGECLFQLTLCSMSSEGSMLNDTSHRTKYNQKHCNICINTSKLESIVMCIIKSFIICSPHITTIIK